MRLTRLFVLLALAALMAPRAEASRTRVWESNPPAALTTPRTDAADLLASLAPAADADLDTAELPTFNLGDVVLVESALEHDERFSLGPLDLLGPTPLRGPPPSYPKTRVGGFELLPPFRVGASPTLSLWSRQACGFSCREVVSDSRYDPWGLAADISSGRQYGEMRRYGTPEDAIAAQRAADQAAIETGVKVDLALAALAVPVARVWQVIRTLPEIWSLGGSAWLYRNAPAVQRATQEVVELANPGPSVVPHGPGAGGRPPARGAGASAPLALPPAKELLALPAPDIDTVIAANYQRYINDAAEDVVKRFNQGKIRIPAGMPWQTVLGQKIDSIARGRMLSFLEREKIAEGPGADVLVNRFLRDPSGSGRYRIPDLMLNRSERILDGTIGAKGPDSPQVVDFGNFSGGYEVVIVRPQTGPLSKPR